MKALVIFESMYGNTHAVADAIAEGLGSDVVTEVRPVHEAGSVPGDVDLLIVGGPTHLHSLTTAFDTRGDARAALTGSAARGIARRLRRRGCDVLDSQSFLVGDAEGPLEDGELDRARRWGMTLAPERPG